MSRNGDDRPELPDPEVVPVAKRRRFTAEEKLRILEEADACTQPGEIGALVRREGIYSSYLSRWRQARDKGQLAGLDVKKRGPKPSPDAALSREVTKLRRENEQLQARLEKAENMAEIEISVLTAQSLDGYIPDIVALDREVTSWQNESTANKASVDWRFTTVKARDKLKRCRWRGIWLPDGHWYAAQGVRRG